MNTRLFEWRDLLVLYRYRHHGLFLDSALVLTRGPLLVPVGALLATIAPGTEVFTYLCEGGDRREKPLVGQVTHSASYSYAHLSFLAPESAVELTYLPALFDQMAVGMGEQGAFHLLAEVDESSQASEALHKAGFAIYARQRIWRLEGEPQGEMAADTWRSCILQDGLNMRALYCDLVPGLVQQVEQQPRQRPKGMVLYRKDVLLAYVEMRYGPRGIWLQPFVHPDAQDFSGHLVRLLSCLPNRRSRPVYLCVRSYQSWLEGATEAVGAVAGSHQAVMVRHLAVSRKALQPLALPAINNTRPEPTAPIARSKA